MLKPNRQESASTKLLARHWVEAKCKAHPARALGQGEDEVGRGLRSSGARIECFNEPAQHDNQEPH